ncbi:MAG TPA: Txe/YoeB family addiction module toxin [Bacteroidetes bacterium]|nr:Txe/YoeB family addiction module toxin [Bacteroidota bacterium]
MYPIHLSKKAVKDIASLRKENPKYAAKLWDLILDIFKHPFTGIGEPEALKGDLRGWWSRRITQKHRLVYRIKNEVLEIASCYGHYGDK